MILISRRDVVSVRAICLLAVVGSLAAQLALRFVLVTTRFIEPWEEWLALGAATLVLGFPPAIGYRRLLRWRMCLFGVAYVLSVVLVNLAVGQLAKLTYFRLGVSLTPYFWSSYVPILLDPVDIAIACALGTIAAWGLSRVLRGPVRIKPELACPRCGYCLAGNRTTDCPECGDRFSWDALGFSADYVICFTQSETTRFVE